MSTEQLALSAQAEGRIEDERRRLQRASAILVGAVLAANEHVDAHVIADASVVARELIDAAVDGLDMVELSRPQQGCIEGTDPTVTPGGAEPQNMPPDSSELIKELLRELAGARRGIDAADSLSAVAGMALRQQDTDRDGDVADVLEDHVYPALAGARDALVTAEEIIERLQQLADEGVTHG